MCVCVCVIYLEEGEWLLLAREDPRRKRCEGEAGAQRVHGQLHSLFALAGARKHAGHDEDDVSGGGDEVDFEAEVPPDVPVGVEAGPEEVDIAGAEDDEVEELGEEGDAWRKKLLAGFGLWVLAGGRW